MAQPFLPIASSEADIRAGIQFQARMFAFELAVNDVKPKTRKRRKLFSEYTAKNCEECWAND